MKMGSGWGENDDEAYLEDDGPTFGGGGERREEKLRRLQQAKEIASGLTMGHGADDETHELAQKIKSRDL